MPQNLSVKLIHTNKQLKILETGKNGPCLLSSGIWWSVKWKWANFEMENNWVYINSLIKWARERRLEIGQRSAWKYGSIMISRHKYGVYCLARRLKPAMRYSSTKCFSNGTTNIVCVIILFPIPGTYVSNIYGWALVHETIFASIRNEVHNRY